MVMCRGVCGCIGVYGYVWGVYGDVYGCMVMYRCILCCIRIYGVV